MVSCNALQRKLLVKSLEGSKMMKISVSKLKKSMGLTLLPIVVAAPFFSAFSQLSAPQPSDENQLQAAPYILCEPYPECVIYGVDAEM